MKHTVLLIFLSACVTAKSQEWAPIGTTWHYNYNITIGIFGEQISSAYCVFESVGDTLIDGISCRKIQKSKYYYPWGNRPTVEYTYYSNDSVFFYDANFSEFHLLYDFDAVPGESWFYWFPGNSFSGDIDTIKTVVDSIDLITINAVVLKRLYVHYEPVGFEEDWMFDNFPGENNSEVIEYLGDLNNFINTFTIDEEIMHFSSPRGLRCYEDNTIGHYETGIVDSCNYVNLASLAEPGKNSFVVYPNPAYSEIRIDAAGQLIQSVRIIATDGRLVYFEQHPLSEVIPVSSLLPGMYIVQVEFSEEGIRQSRFVKD